MSKIRELLFSTTYTIRERLFLLSAIIGSVAMFVAFVLSVISGDSWITGLAPLVGFVIVSATTYYSFKNKLIDYGSVIISILSICFILPYGFLKGGGVYSGSPAWFIVGIVIVFMLFKGRMLYIVYAITVVVFGAIVYYSYLHPESVSLFGNNEAIYVDQYLASLLIGTMLGILLFYQNTILDRELKVSEKQNKEIEDLNAAQNRFFSSMSHEIRTPINTIIGLNETTLREKGLSEDVVENSLNIQNASRMLLSLINDILDLSKIQSGQMELAESQYETSRMFSDIVNLLWNRARDKGLQFNINIGDNIPSMLYGDEIRIKQVIINLLTNAIKYTNEGTVTLNVDGEKTKTNNFVLRIGVVDTGQGIRKESIPYIFDSFKRVDSDSNKAIEGTGLGLSITKQLVDLMGGQITVDSIYTKGSTFRVSIPQKIVSEAPMNFKAITEINRELQEYHQVFEAPEARVLIVDDNDMNRMVCQKLLRETKVKTDAVGSGKEALELTLQKRYNAIFMDHEMPDMDGIETLRRMRNQTNGLCHDTPVVALTANAGSDRNAFYMEHGFQAYLAKPIHGSLLEATLMQLLPSELIETTQVVKEDDDIVQVLQNQKKKDIIISTDSGCDLPNDMVEYYGIRVIPNYIITKEGRFRDYEEIDAGNLTNYLKEGNEIMTESAPIDEYEEFFGQLLTEAESVIHLSTTNLLSKTYENALKAAESFDNVKVINTGTLSAGLGMIATECAKLAIKGKHAQEIVDEIPEFENRVVSSYLVPSVDMISKRHHVSLLAKLIIKAFNTQVSFSIQKEKIKLKGFYISYVNDEVLKFIKTNLKNNANIDDEVLYIVHSGYTQEERTAIIQEIKKYMNFKEIIVEKATATFVANVGLRFIGLVYNAKQ